MTKTRLDSIRKKKTTVLKYLKNDIAELLKSRLDYNAYNRVSSSSWLLLFLKLGFRFLISG